MREIAITSTTRFGNLKFKFEYHEEKTFFYVASDTYYNLYNEVEKLVQRGYINVYKAFDNYHDDQFENLVKLLVAENTEEIV